MKRNKSTFSYFTAKKDPKKTDEDDETVSCTETDSYDESEMIAEIPASPHRRRQPLLGGHSPPKRRFMLLQLLFIAVLATIVCNGVLMSGTIDGFKNLRVHGNRTIVFLIGNLRCGEPAWESLYENVLDYNNADLGLVVGSSDDKYNDASLWKRAKYVFREKEYEDWGDALGKYECVTKTHFSRSRQLNLIVNSFFFCRRRHFGHRRVERRSGATCSRHGEGGRSAWWREGAQNIRSHPEHDALLVGTAHSRT